MDEKGFNKIDLDPKQTVSSRKLEINTPKIKFALPKTKKALIILAVLMVLVLVVFYTSVKTVAILSQARQVYSQVKKASDAAKKQNAAKTKEELVKTKNEVEKLKAQIAGIKYVGYVPIFGGYYSDAEHLINASNHGVDAALIVVESLLPYADVLGLKGEKSFVGGSAEDRIRTAVVTLDKVVPRIDDIEAKVTLAKEEIDKVNPGHYPNFWVFKKIRDRLTLAKTTVDEGVVAVDAGKPLIKVLPELLGASKSKKYLILFQNDNELRPTGGFLTYYSIFRIDQGVIHIDSSNDIYRLDDSIRGHPKAPDIILKYLPKVPTFNIRDSNLSPDFAESMKTFNEFYEKSTLAADIDGIIALDTDFLVHVIDILGEVQAGGQTFTSKNDPRCNCPQVVYQLELNTTKPVGHVRTDRKAIVGELLYQTMKKALGVSPKLYWGKLFQQAIVDAQEKHILFAIENPKAQKGIEALNWAGRIKSFEGDYLHINDANFSGAKTNMFIKEKSRIDYKIESDGTAIKTLTMEYRNPEPHSDCNLERGGLCLNAVHRDFQRIFVPKGSTLISSKGSQVKVETRQDLGKTYFEAFFTVNPLGKSSITYTYKLPFKVEKKVLPVMIQKQPGVEVIPMEIYVNGNRKESFDLRTDKILNLSV